MCAILQKKGKKGEKNVKKGQNIWKFGKKCTKFENISTKCRWLHAICNNCMQLTARQGPGMFYTSIWRNGD